MGHLLVPESRRYQEKNASQTAVTVFYHPVTEMRASPFCHIPLVRGRSPRALEGSSPHKGTKTGRRKLLGAASERPAAVYDKYCSEPSTVVMRVCLSSGTPDMDTCSYSRALTPYSLLT